MLHWSNACDAPDWRIKRLIDSIFFTWTTALMGFLEIFFETIPVFLMIGVGCVLRMTHLVEEAAEKSVMRVILNVLYPCFILSRVPGNESLQLASNVLLALSCGFGLTLLGMAISLGVGRALGVQSGKDRNTFCLSTAIQNYGFIPIALIEGLFPERATEVLGVLFVHNLGLELAMWTVGIIIISGSGKGAFRRLLNGPAIAIGVGLILNVTGWYQWIPIPASKAISQLGNCTIPISLVLVGVSLAGVLMQDRWKSIWSVIFGCLVVRFLLMPAIFIGVALLFSNEHPLRLILVIEAAMPAAIFPIVISKHFGGNPSVAVQVTVITSIVSLILTPAILTLALQWTAPSLESTFAPVKSSPRRTASSLDLNSFPSAVDKPDANHQAS